MYYATAGNILVFSICGDTVHANRAFTWTQGGYQRTEADIPPVTFTVSDGTDPICVTEDIQDINKDTDPNEVVSVIESGVNAMQEKNPQVCFGPVSPRFCIISSFAFSLCVCTLFFTAFFTKTFFIGFFIKGC